MPRGFTIEELTILNGARGFGRAVPSRMATGRRHLRRLRHAAHRLAADGYVTLRHEASRLVVEPADGLG